MTDGTLKEIGKGFWHFKSKEEDFHRNIYLKRFVGPDGKSINMIFDPGTKPDMPMILDTLNNLIGGIQNIDLIFLSHQDPDLTTNISAFLDSAPRSRLVASIDTWRLVRTYGIDEKRFYAVENFKNRIMRLAKTGHRVQFVPAYFCHFRGAMMFYDFETNILFSGDFLGGVNSRKGKGIYATEESWDGISLFHQIYMPSREAVTGTVNRISLLHPIPEVIAPQHGDVIKGELVVEFLSRLMDLEVGFDIIKKGEPEKELTLMALNTFMDSLSEKEPEVHKRLIGELKKTGTFTTIFVLAHNSLVDTKVSTREAFLGIWGIVMEIAKESNLPEIRALLSSAIDKYGLDVDSQMFKGPDREDALEDLFED